MKAVKVEYTVKAEYVEKNKANIRSVMDALRTNPIDGMMYSSYQKGDDPTTFVHINFAKDEATKDQLNKVEAFQVFRSELKASQPVSSPQSTILASVGSNFDL